MMTFPDQNDDPDDDDDDTGAINDAGRQRWWWCHDDDDEEEDDDEDDDEGDDEDGAEGNNDAGWVGLSHANVHTGGAVQRPTNKVEPIFRRPVVNVKFCIYLEARPWRPTRSCEQGRTHFRSTSILQWSQPYSSPHIVFIWKEWQLHKQ